VEIKQSLLLGSISTRRVQTLICIILMKIVPADPDINDEQEEPVPSKEKALSNV